MTDKTIMNPCIECGGNCCRAQIEGISCSSMFYEPRPHGEWITAEDKTYITCKNCGYTKGFKDANIRTHFDPLPNYCEKCGSDNRN